MKSDVSVLADATQLMELQSSRVPAASPAHVGAVKPVRSQHRVGKQLLLARVRCSLEQDSSGTHLKTTICTWLLLSRRAEQDRRHKVVLELHAYCLRQSI